MSEKGNGQGGLNRPEKTAVIYMCTHMSDEHPDARDHIFWQWANAVQIAADNDFKILTEFIEYNMTSGNTAPQYRRMMRYVRRYKVNILMLADIVKTLKEEKCFEMRYLEMNSPQATIPLASEQ